MFVLLMCSVISPEIGLISPRMGFDQRGFASSVWPDNANKVSRKNFHRNIFRVRYCCRIRQKGFLFQAVFSLLCCYFFGDVEHLFFPVVIERVDNDYFLHQFPRESCWANAESNSF